MNTEDQKKIRKKITIGTIVGLVAVIAILACGMWKGFLSIAAFNTIACLYLLAYWAATDVLEPKLTGELKEITPERKNAYFKYAGVSLAGYVGLMVFIVSATIDGASNIGMIGIIVYALSFSSKRRFHTEYLHPENGDAAAEAAPSGDESADGGESAKTGDSKD